jgi:TPR repeat protein
MTFLNTSLIRKLTLFLAAAMLSFSAMASSDLNDTLRLANEGSAEAQYKLGVLYNEGFGVNQDYFKAFDWTKKAANQGGCYRSI